MVYRRGGGHTQSGPRIPDGDSDRDRGRRSGGCWRTPDLRLRHGRRRWLVVAPQPVCPSARKTHSRDLKVEPHWPRKLGHMANGLGCSARSGCAQERRLSLNPSLRPKSRPAPQVTRAGMGSAAVVMVCDENRCPVPTSGADAQWCHRASAPEGAHSGHLIKRSVPLLR